MAGEGVARPGTIDGELRHRMGLAEWRARLPVFLRPFFFFPLSLLGAMGGREGSPTLATGRRTLYGRLLDEDRIMVMS